jgi:hypothetical protein
MVTDMAEKLTLKKECRFSSSASFGPPPKRSSGVLMSKCLMKRATGVENCRGR